MIEKDNIQELFSKAFENHSAPVNPELWAGVQAKMSAAGVATGGAATVKGLSALTKWIIGSAAMATVGVTTAVLLNTQTDTEQPTKAQTEVSSQNEEAQQNTKPSISGGDNSSSTTSNNKPDAIIGFTLPQIVEPIVYDPEIIEFLQKDPVLIQNSESSGTGNLGDGSVQSAGNSEGSQQGEQSGGSNGVGNEQVSPSVQKDPVYAKAKLEFPNVFSPNGDGSNETYHLNTKENVQAVQVTIINTDNKEVFVSDDINFEWNGNLYGTGEAVPAGMYACVVVYTDLSGKKEKSFKLFELKR